MPNATSVRYPQDVLDKLKELATERKMSLSKFLVSIAKNHVEREAGFDMRTHTSVMAEFTKNVTRMITARLWSDDMKEKTYAIGSLFFDAIRRNEDGSLAKREDGHIDCIVPESPEFEKVLLEANDLLNRVQQVLDELKQFPKANGM